MESTQFRPLTEDGLPLMHRWLNLEHVMRFYSPGGMTYEAVKRKYLPRINGTEPTYSYLIMDGEFPVGYIQAYLICDFPDYARAIGVDDRAAGVDLFLGEPNYIGRGLGPAIIRQFLREVVWGRMGASACVIGPEVHNQAAIRAYAKAGFRYWKSVQVPDEPEPEYLMRLQLPISS